VDAAHRALLESWVAGVTERVDAVADVVPGDHAWGRGLRVSGLVAGSAVDVWLV